MDGARFDRFTRALSSRRGLLGGVASALGALVLGSSEVGAATCKALGRPCTRQLECCSRSCLRPDGPDGRPQERRRCLCRETSKLPCGGRCCTRQQTCKRGKCVHHCKDGRISGDETDKDCGGDDCKKCGTLKRCDRPSDCASGHCRVQPDFGPEPRCAECITDADCRNPARPRCSSVNGGPGSSGHCFACINDDHCPPQAPICNVGVCEGSSGSCDNGLRDGNETDVDCGGPECLPCIVPQFCQDDDDCVTGHCGDMDIFGDGPERRCSECFSDDHCPDDFICSIPICD